MRRYLCWNSRDSRPIFARLLIHPIRDLSIARVTRLTRRAGTRAHSSCPMAYASTIPPALLRLQSLDVVGKIRNPLLHFSFVSATHAPEQFSPYRHIF